jgi:hypothetical protein
MTWKDNSSSQPYKPEENRSMKKWGAIVFAVCMLSVGGGSGICMAFDLGNGFSISNVTYLDFTSASGDLFEIGKGITNSDANTNEGIANGFHFTRVYLTLVKQVNDQMLIRITTDQMGPDTNNSFNEAAPFGLKGYGGSGRENLFIKYAYVQYKFAPELMLRVGQTQTAWIDSEEGRWGYRFLRPIFVDEMDLLTSSDLGISAMGSLLDQMISYQVMFSNGEGYQTTPNGRGFALQGRLDLMPVTGLTFSAFGLAETVHGGTSGDNRNREIYMVMYDHKLFRVGAEYVMANNNAGGPAGSAAIENKPSGNPSTAAVTYHGFDQAKGYGAWGWLRIPNLEALRLFARYDQIKPNHATDAGKTQQIYGGISYDVLKGLIVALDDTYLNQQAVSPGPGPIESYRDNIVGVRAELSF